MNTITDVASFGAQPRTPASVKIFSVIVAILPVLATYASGLPGFSLADVVLVAFTVYALFRPDMAGRNKFSASSVILISGLVMICVFDLFALAKDQRYLYETAIRTIRYGYYVVCFLIAGRRFIDVGILRGAVRAVSVLACVYIAIQYVVYRLLGRVLLGFLPFLKLYVEGYANRDYETLFKTMFRPTSFFLEPGHFARYAVLGLIIVLWSKEFKSRDLFTSIFISVGILVSTSSQGYVILALVWVCFLFGRASRIKKNWLKILGFTCIIVSPLIIQLLLQMPFVQKTLLRSLAGSINDGNTALGARLGGFLSFLSLPTYNKIFGMGFGVIPTSQWLSSAAYWLYGSGIIVSLVYTLLHFGAIIKLRGMQRIVMLVMVVLFFVDDSFYSYMCVLFYSLAMLTANTSTVASKQPEVEIEKTTLLIDRAALG